MNTLYFRKKGIIIIFNRLLMHFSTNDLTVQFDLFSFDHYHTVVKYAALPISKQLQFDLFI